MSLRRSFSRKLVGVAFAALCGTMLAGCEEQTSRSGRAWRAIPGDTLALMSQIGTDKRAPILIRTYKKEAELEIWKMKADGRYALLKTFPMCRWSGQLGPKTREGDRQVPEGFYQITPAQMNPTSNYYLSFNVGYPNALDRAYGRTGALIMVHGACSSAGCFSMTDDQIAEIYAVAREAFGGGQKAIQMQSLPFRMNADNLAKHRFDPNMAFWKQLKEGVDNFDVTKQEPLVNVCNRRYVFNQSPIDANARFDATAICPPTQQDEAVKAAVAGKHAADEQKVAELVQKGVKPIKLVYADGGQHPSFAHVSEVSRPDALAAGATEIELRDNGKPKPALVQVAAAKAAPLAANADKPAATPAVAGSTSVPASAPAVPPLVATAQDAGAPKPSTPFYRSLLGLASDTKAPDTVEIIEPAVPREVDVPLPPRRASRPLDAKPHAAIKRAVDREASLGGSTGLPAVIVGAQPVLPGNFMAFAPLTR